MTAPTKRMLTAEQWFAVPSCPCAGPDEKYGKHLLKLQPRHLDVTMAVLPDGSEVKIDGHKRARVWKEKLSDTAPSAVHATVFSCENMNDVFELYHMF